MCLPYTFRRMRAARLPADAQRKGVPPARRTEAQGAHVAAFGQPEGERGAHRRGDGVLPAHHGGGRGARIGGVGVEQRLGAAVALEVVDVGVEDDRDGRAQLADVAAILAHFRHETAVSPPPIAAVVEVLAADVRGTAAARLQDVRAHGGRRRLAVAARDADRHVEPVGDEGEQVGAVVDGHARRARGDELRVVVGDGGTAHHRVRSGGALRRMAADKADAPRFQRGRAFAADDVTARDGESSRQKAGRQRAHADAARADQVNFLLFWPKFSLHGINICRKEGKIIFFTRVLEFFSRNFVYTIENSENV